MRYRRHVLLWPLLYGLLIWWLARRYPVPPSLEPFGPADVGHPLHPATPSPFNPFYR